MTSPVSMTAALKRRGAQLPNATVPKMKQWDCLEMTHL